MRKPRVFIGSSTEGLDIAQAIEFDLSRDMDAKAWNRGVFGLGRTVIEQIVPQIAAADYAVLVVRADDVVVTRGNQAPSARANILFELGIAMGVLGRRRTYIVYDVSAAPIIISDLSGTLMATYDGSLTNLSQAVAGACFQIRAQTREKAEEVWYTEWQLGAKRYVEHLRLWGLECNPLKGTTIRGVREYSEEGGSTQYFGVQGFRGRGLYWLEYHRDDAFGGGTILLSATGAGKAVGIITAGHCDSGVLRAYRNGWVLNGSASDHNAAWLMKLSEVPPSLASDG